MLSQLGMHVLAAKLDYGQMCIYVGMLFAFFLDHCIIAIHPHCFQWEVTETVELLGLGQIRLQENSCIFFFCNAYSQKDV